ncbi:MAG: helix-turn-helix domain-containing protein [Bacilli bacterium]|jgi:hypothetical protein|nr:helix-turn-helix domain-containing protein [Bacilli bacterium]
MTKFYLYQTSAPFDEKAFGNALDSLGAPYDWTALSPTEGYLVADENFLMGLGNLVMPLHDDLRVIVTFLCAHARGPLEQKALRQAVAYFPNQALYLTDVLMKEFSFGDYSSLPLLSAEFKGVPHELMLTAGTFLRCGLNATLASENLIIHRNTFNYRLSRFIERTGLDIRDYHNALLLEVYFQLGSHR